MKTTSELAMETADKLSRCALLSFPDHQNGKHQAAELIQSALDAQAAQYRKAIKVATDAFESLRNNQNSRDCAGVVATTALTRIAELTPKP